MTKILIPIDGSQNSLRALAYAIAKMPEYKNAPELHLVNVQTPLHGGISGFVDAAQLKQWHQDEANQALASARAQLQQAGLAFREHIFVGDPADTIARHANEQGYDEIVIGTRGHTPMASMLLGSVSSKLLHLATMPIVLVR